jgi:hypothetical protein
MGIFGKKVKRLPRYGQSIQFKPSFAIVATGTIVHVYDENTVEVRITWTGTSVFELNKSYQVDLLAGNNWQLVP